MADSTNITLHSQEDLDAIRCRVSTTMVDMVDRSVQSLDKLSKRLDKVDDAMDRLVDVDKMTVNELIAYQGFMRESFKMRQEFLRTLSGYDVNVSKVPVRVEAQSLMDEDAACALRDEVLRRGG